MNPKKAFLKSDFLLEIGQLTTRGFMQHIQLGEQFKRYYGNTFLQSVTHSGNIYVRSTNYARTVQVEACQRVTEFTSRGTGVILNYLSGFFHSQFQVFS